MKETQRPMHGMCWAHRILEREEGDSTAVEREAFEVGGAGLQPQRCLYGESRVGSAKSKPRMPNKAAVSLDLFLRRNNLGNAVAAYVWVRKAQPSRDCCFNADALHGQLAAALQSSSRSPCALRAYSQYISCCRRTGAEAGAVPV